MSFNAVFTYGNRTDTANSILRGVEMAAGYTFDADALADRIRQLEDILGRVDDNNQMLSLAASTVVPPSQDGPAGAQAKATVMSIALAISHNKAMRDYAQAYLDQLCKAAGCYVAQEDETGAVFVR
ncbi:hypothetical protein [Amycolatopsis sp. 195334CR]|uniref:hypothetical protein n=1 Tax=Amycolatopsis sp. 195334CR TaxID=2814588 RepID=UPI001A8FDAF6|nr:hypothetical protein [Amycolatopsis sp. 195334CR]MBN6035379.1 hypothetical protein [Amycolatopsis sp. 195334CR]